MKTDLERFIELYKSFGIECIVGFTQISPLVKKVNSLDKDSGND